MVVFCPKCRTKHALKECPLENVQNVQVCAFCTENHDISHCSKIKILQNCNLEANAEMENLYFMGARRPWQTRPPGMFQNPNLQFPAHDSWNVPMPWQNWSNQQHQSYPQQQWRPYQQYLNHTNNILNHISNTLSHISSILKHISNILNNKQCPSTSTYSTNIICSSTNKSTTTTIII
jgi:hypothetical protein